MDRVTPSPVQDWFVAARYKRPKVKVAIVATAVAFIVSRLFLSSLLSLLSSPLWSRRRRFTCDERREELNKRGGACLSCAQMPRGHHLDTSSTFIPLPLPPSLPLSPKCQMIQLRNNNLQQNKIAPSGVRVDTSQLLPSPRHEPFIQRIT